MTCPSVSSRPAPSRFTVGRLEFHVIRQCMSHPSECQRHRSRFCVMRRIPRTLFACVALPKSTGKSHRSNEGPEPNTSVRSRGRILHPEKRLPLKCRPIFVLLRSWLVHASLVTHFGRNSTYFNNRSLYNALIKLKLFSAPLHIMVKHLHVIHPLFIFLL